MQRVMIDTAGNTCHHVEIERLGSNNGMSFERCLNCRSVIVTQGGTSIVLPSPPEPEPSNDRRRPLFRMGRMRDRM